METPSQPNYEFGNSRNGNAPFKFQFGTGKVLPAFEKAISSMVIGEQKKFSLSVEEAYGQVVENAIQKIPRSQSMYTSTLLVQNKF